MLFSFRVFILWLHLLAAVVWIGGLCFQLLVLPPALARSAGMRERLRLGLSLEAYFRFIVWPAVGVVLLTGLYNVMNVLYLTTLSGGRMPSTFVRVLSWKLGCVVLMIILQAVAHLVLRPQRIALLRQLPLEAAALPPALARLQRVSTLLHSLIVVLAAAAVLGGILLRG
jgi:uncharacterized membrane protein